MPRAVEPWRLRTALLAAAFYAVHAVELLFWRHEPESLLWTCQTATLLLVPGTLLPSARVVAIAAHWLVLGNAFWVLGLALGADFYPTSLLTHFGSLALAVVAARRLGVPRGSWWQALGAMAALQALSRAVTPPEANVNIAHHVWPGFERVFPSYAPYWIANCALSAGVFFATERAIERLAASTGTGTSTSTSTSTRVA